MSRLHLIATAVKHGRGGISTALVGFTETAVLKQQGLNIIESHVAGGRWAAYRQAAARIQAEVQAGDVVWLHCARWLSMLRKLMLARIARKRGAKVYFHFHSMVTEHYMQHWLGRRLLKRMIKAATGIVVVSDWWKQRFVDVLKVPAAQIFVCPNPLDQSFQNRAPRETLVHADADDPVQLLAMTRLVPGKGVAETIAALAALPTRFHLKVAGEGPLESALREQVKQLGLQDRVEFLGWIDYDKKLDVLQGTDIFCLPSQFDSFGMGFIEAMALGIPVVAFNGGPTASVVPHKACGYLVDSLSPAAIAAAVQHCVTHYTEYASAAYQHTQSNFSAEVIAQRWVQFYSK
ncbi:glycosyltransferase family 4 protein [Pseudidiomarina aestuarii]|uniref:glycosyltransferase family 4 protein n=1 Tax=Pseudidiomarina aestuarii TaxID=624146 RepID=UPI003A970CE1